MSCLTTLSAPKTVLSLAQSLSLSEEKPMSESNDSESSSSYQIPESALKKIGGLSTRVGEVLELVLKSWPKLSRSNEAAIQRKLIKKVRGEALCACHRGVTQAACCCQVNILWLLQFRPSI